MNMGKIILSTDEFNILVESYIAPKEGGRHVRWRDFCDAIEEVFTKKGLEKQVDLVLDDVRTKTLYGKVDPTRTDREIVNGVLNRFKDFLQRHRLDAKSFF